MRSVGTDGRRLSFSDCKFEGPSIDDADPLQFFTLDREAAKSFLRLLPKRLGADPSPVRVWVPPLNGLLVALAYEGVEVISRVLDGDYPRYQAVIPKTVTTRITVNVDALLRALTTVESALNADSRAVCMTLDGSELQLRARSSNGEATASCVLEQMGATPEVCKWGLNIDYLKDVLRTVCAPTVEIGWTSDGSPVLFELGDGARAIVMPITIED
jgi:DNA polymerase-3 subunit beta